eukprot:TRINITY_DN1324_c0_g1_i1.p1 TRINITY_DN1324_c0_g1~~TRINITY_DN1324_c0_g1_i1.p1  ORF type:complete len:1165 (+),score=227.60 TRINITY_DN1324_c0_g1_i1:42-3536(+)
MQRPLLQSQQSPTQKGILVGWGKDKRREAAVIALEVMGVRTARILLLSVLVAVGFAIAMDSSVDWKTQPMEIIFQDEEGDGTVILGGVVRTQATFLSISRMRWKAQNTGNSGTIDVDYIITFRDHDNKQVAKYAASGDDEVGSRQQLSCGSSTCDYMYQPGWNSAVYFPAGGVLNVTLEIDNYKKSFPWILFDPATDLFADIQYRDSHSPWYVVETIIRYISICLLVPHFIRYHSLCKESSDPLRPEHNIIWFMFIFIILYCNPLSGFAYLHRTGENVDTFMIILLLQVPQVSVSYMKGAMFSLVVSLKMPKGRMNAYLAIAVSVAVLVFLQLCYCLSENSAFVTLEMSIGVASGSALSFAIKLVYIFVQVIATIYVLVNLFGCSNCWGISRTLKMFPYVPTRDRQLGIRMLRPIIVMLFVWQGAVALMTSPDRAGVGSVVLLSVVVHTLAFTTVPVFQNGDNNTPPSPLTDEWKGLVWQKQWFQWVAETPGGLALYPFVTVEEENEFWELQKSRIPDTKPTQVFNYERCLWTLHFSAMAYELDAYSPLVAAVVGALVVAVSSEDREPNSPDYKKVTTKKQKEPVGKVMSLDDPFKIIRVINCNSMQVLLGRQDGLLVVSFRGSSNVKNWKDDLKFPRMPWTEMTEGEEVKNGYCYTKTPLVHKGFLSVWKSVRDLVFNVVEKYKNDTDTTIIVTGHSLGGAMATLASYSLAKHFQEISFQLWTYGCPYVGNSSFAQLHVQRVENAFRVINENDAVATTSFTFDNCHVGKQVTLGIHGGMIAIDPPYFEKWWAPARWLWNSALAHSMLRYKEAITSSFQVVHSDYFTKDEVKESLVLPGWVGSTQHEAGFQDEGCSQSCCCFGIGTKKSQPMVFHPDYQQYGIAHSPHYVQSDYRHSAFQNYAQPQYPPASPVYHSPQQAQHSPSFVRQSVSHQPVAVQPAQHHYQQVAQPVQQQQHYQPAQQAVVQQPVQQHYQQQVVHQQAAYQPPQVVHPTYQQQVHHQPQYAQQHHPQQAVHYQQHQQYQYQQQQQQQQQQYQHQHQQHQQYQYQQQQHQQYYQQQQQQQQQYYQQQAAAYPPPQPLAQQPAQPPPVQQQPAAVVENGSTGSTDTPAGASQVELSSIQNISPNESARMSPDALEVTVDPAFVSSHQPSPKDAEEVLTPLE